MNRRSFFQATLAGLLVLGGVAAPTNTVQAEAKKVNKQRKPRSKASKKKKRHRRHDTLRHFHQW